jgi:hypothetical protein
LGWSLAVTLSGPKQGCQMSYFQAKNPSLGKFWRELQWKMLVYFMAIWSILQPFGIFCGHLVYFTAIWSILWPFGNFYGYLVYFSTFWYVVPRKIWQPWSENDVMLSCRTLTSLRRRKKRRKMISSH